MQIQEMVKRLLGSGEGDEKQQQRRQALQPRPRRWYRMYNPWGSSSFHRRRYMHISTETPDMWFTNPKTGLRKRKKA